LFWDTGGTGRTATPPGRTELCESMKVTGYLEKKTYLKDEMEEKGEEEDERGGKRGCGQGESNDV